jgi:hypothetical protein
LVRESLIWIILRESGAALTRLRQLCIGLPDAHEKISHGEPAFWTPRRMFASFASASNHHGAGRDAAWILAAPGRQDRMVKTAPARFFVPPYVGVNGGGATEEPGRPCFRLAAAVPRPGRQTETLARRQPLKSPNRTATIPAVRS